MNLGKLSDHLAFCSISEPKPETRMSDNPTNDSPSGQSPKTTNPALNSTHHLLPLLNYYQN